MLNCISVACCEAIVSLWVKLLRYGSFSQSYPFVSQEPTPQIFRHWTCFPQLAAILTQGCMSGNQCSCVINYNLKNMHTFFMPHFVVLVPCGILMYYMPTFWRVASWTFRRSYDCCNESEVTPIKIRKDGSILAQVMACCLTAPSYYLYQLFY